MMTAATWFDMDDDGGGVLEFDGPVPLELEAIRMGDGTYVFAWVAENGNLLRIVWPTPE